ncbi:MAG: acyl-ACP--UDP-N-acetylglucosamine O-acyltransferase [Betaproteobacteria bacterium]|nr:acyl-ACP--UDP-N-acetylglucosamine O-acyltransferase [Betaproteobacteria bacterium]
MIHATAVVHPNARLGSSVEVGPFTVVGEHVEIGDGTTIGAHCVLTGHTTIGAENRIFHFASIGEAPQDKKYAGEATRLEIGDRNTIREYCTINSGTVQDAGVTRVGNDNWIMAYVHIAHDCTIGNHTIFANCTQLAGHVHVDDWVILGGFTGIHQFCRIGAHAMTAISSVVVHDLPPYVMAQGDTAKAHGINSEGLKRRGFTPEAIGGIRRAYKTLYREGHTLEEAKRRLADLAAECTEVAVIVEFLSRSTRGIVR